MGWRVSILMLLVLQLALVGCGGSSGGGGSSSGGWGGGGGGGGGGSGTQFVAATANDLANHSFTFPIGLSPILAIRFGLSARQEFTLQFGPFTGATVSLTL